MQGNKRVKRVYLILLWWEMVSEKSRKEDHSDIPKAQYLDNRYVQFK